MRLYYTKPAGHWEEVLSIDNGSLAVMLWDGITNDHFGLNEDTLC